MMGLNVNNISICARFGLNCSDVDKSIKLGTMIV